MLWQVPQSCFNAALGVLSLQTIQRPPRADITYQLTSAPAQFCFAPGQPSYQSVELVSSFLRVRCFVLQQVLLVVLQAFTCLISLC